MDISIYKIRLIEYFSSLELYEDGDFYLYKKDNKVILERCDYDHVIKIKNNRIIEPLIKEVGYNVTIFILTDVLSKLEICKKHIIKINYIKI